MLSISVQGDVAAFGKAATVVGAHVTRTIGVSVRLWVR